MDNEESLPNADDVQVDGQTEAQLLDARRWPGRSS